MNKTQKIKKKKARKEKKNYVYVTNETQVLIQLAKKQKLKIFCDDIEM